MTATQITFMNNSYLTSVKDTVRETQRYNFEKVLSSKLLLRKPLT